MRCSIVKLTILGSLEVSSVLLVYACVFRHDFGLVFLFSAELQFLTLFETIYQDSVNLSLSVLLFKVNKQTK